MTNIEVELLGEQSNVSVVRMPLSPVGLTLTVVVMTFLQPGTVRAGFTIDA